MFVCNYHQLPDGSKCHDPVVLDGRTARVKGDYSTVYSSMQQTLKCTPTKIHVCHTHVRAHTHTHTHTHTSHMSHTHQNIMCFNEKMIKHVDSYQSLLGDPAGDPLACQKGF